MTGNGLNHLFLVRWGMVYEIVLTKINVFSPDHVEVSAGLPEAPLLNLGDGWFISTVGCLNTDHGNHISNPTKSPIASCMFCSDFSGGSWSVQAK